VVRYVGLYMRPGQTSVPVQNFSQIRLTVSEEMRPEQTDRQTVRHRQTDRQTDRHRQTDRQQT